MEPNIAEIAKAALEQISRAGKIHPGYNLTVGSKLIFTPGSQPGIERFFYTLDYSGVTLGQTYISLTSGDPRELLRSLSWELDYFVPQEPEILNITTQEQSS